MNRTDEVWKSETLAQTFVEGVRGGIPFASDQIEVMLRLIAVRGEPVERFVDLGCGSGVLARAILARHPQAFGVLVDFSEPMLKQAQSQLSDYADRVRLTTGDFAEPAWTQAVADLAPFDAVVSGFAIHHQPDARKREVYKEVFETLKPGGVFVNVEHVASATAWVEAVHDEYFVDALHAYHTQAGAGKDREQVAREYVHRPDKIANILAPVDVQCEWLRADGYVDVDCYFKIFELAVFGGRRPIEG